MNSSNCKGCVYLARNAINKKIYIGYTNQTLGRRITAHLSAAKTKENDRYFYNAIKKYGKDNFLWTILFLSNDQSKLKEIERECIKLYESNNRLFGYNLTTGGEGASLNTEIKSKISRKAKERNLFGKRNPFFGKSHSKETRQKLSRVRSGKRWSPFEKHTEETKKRLSDIRRNLAKDPEFIEKMRRCQKSISIRCLDTGEVFYSIAEAARQTGIGRSILKSRIRSGSLRPIKPFNLRFERLINEKSDN